MSVRQTIISQIITISEQQHKPILPLSDDLPLLESGLDSLCIAVLVATLDDQLGMYPFGGDDDVPFPVTVGDFIRRYENASA
jgi:hypothetical protein